MSSFILLFFFFKQKTAYEMRIIDWISDLFSSDLDQYLELSVIGLDHVIEILHLPVGRLPVKLSFALQFGDRCTIARRFVGIERGRLFPVLQASQGLAQEPLRCLGAAGRRQVEIDRVAPLVDCPVQVGPLAPHLDVGFIQTPARIKATPPDPTQPLLHLRSVALAPAIDLHMLHRNAAFRQHFLKVAIADRIATIPAHRPQEHITLEMAPLEIRHRSVRPISAKHAQASRFLQQSPSAASVRMTICRPPIRAWVSISTRSISGGRPVRFSRPQISSAWRCFAVPRAPSSGGTPSVARSSSRPASPICRMPMSIFPEISANARSSNRSEEHTSELQSLMRISYAVFCLKKKIKINS